MTGFKRLAAILLSLTSAFFLTLLAQAKPISELTRPTRPQLASILGDLSYLPETAQRLKNPILIYADVDWFIERGYDMPRELTPAAEKKILDALAWAGPVKGEPASAYASETKTFFSDYYGGENIGNHRGGGRTGSLGEIQIKGLLRTKMVHHSELSDEEHSSGTASLTEGIDEVMRSQIAHRESPFGANRVIALIATGTWVGSGADRQMRVLIVREDPLRPAHFIVNIASAKLVREKNRMKYVMTNIDRALPLPSGAALERKADRIEAGVREYIERTAKVSAYHYANQLFHSAYSVSNTEISGAVLDFGAFLGFEGYPKAGRPEDREWNGNIVAQKNAVRELISSLRAGLPKELREKVPTLLQAEKMLSDAFADHLRRELNVLTGLPPELLEKFDRQAGAHELAKVIWEISRHGHGEPIDALNEKIPRSGTFDLNEILVKMANAFHLAGSEYERKRFEKDLDSILRPEIVEAPLRKRLIKEYVGMLTRVRKAAQAEGISLASLQKYVALAAEIRNRKNPHMIVDGQSADHWVDLMSQFQADRDPRPLRRALADAIEASRRNFRDAQPYTLVLRESRVASGEFQREVFELRTGLSKTLRFKVQAVAPVARLTCRALFER